MKYYKWSAYLVMKRQSGRYRFILQTDASTSDHSLYSNLPTCLLYNVVATWTSFDSSQTKVIHLLDKCILVLCLMFISEDCRMTLTMTTYT